MDKVAGRHSHEGALLLSSRHTLQQRDFDIIREAVRTFCGIAYGRDALSLFERRLQNRLRASGCSEFGAYAQLIGEPGAGKAELEEAVEALVVNETYFFREWYQLYTFQKDILPRLRTANEQADRRRLVVWSAGCSTGEEVYSIAMLLLQSRLFRDWDVNVFGSDISRPALAVARKAVYGVSSFRAMPLGFQDSFVDGREGREVGPEARRICHFGQVNLLETAQSQLVGQVDAIFCRNVLIYLDSEARRRVIATFFDRLVPGGYLMLGHSESLINAATDFELVQIGSDLVYRKPTAAPARAVSSR